MCPVFSVSYMKLLFANASWIKNIVPLDAARIISETEEFSDQLNC